MVAMYITAALVSALFYSVLAGVHDKICSTDRVTALFLILRRRPRSIAK